MKSLNGVAVVAAWSAMAVGGSAVAQEAVQWRVENGGNGHWYEVHLLSSNMPDLTSAVAALSTTGRTPAIFDDESEWLGYGSIAGGLSDGGHGHFGVYRPPNGEWQRLDGLPLTFTAWGPGLPNNYAYQFVVASAHPIVGCGIPNGCWEDYGTHETGFRQWVVEWSADCNADGLVDYGQILDGTFEDANGNGVPDCCDEGVSCDPCVGDVNNDGQVNGADISVLLGFWGLNGKPVAADINKDGSVDGADLAAMLGGWGECP